MFGKAVLFANQEEMKINQNYPRISEKNSSFPPEIIINDSGVDV
jgi:hypothetical protein